MFRGRTMPAAGFKSPSSCVFPYEGWTGTQKACGEVSSASHWAELGKPCHGGGNQQGLLAPESVWAADPSWCRISTAGPWRRPAVPGSPIFRRTGSSPHTSYGRFKITATHSTACFPRPDQPGVLRSGSSGQNDLLARAGGPAAERRHVSFGVSPRPGAFSRMLDSGRQPGVPSARTARTDCRTWWRAIPRAR